MPDAALRHSCVIDFSRVPACVGKELKEMKRNVVLFLLLVSITMAASSISNAQSNSPALPANLGKYVDKYPGAFLKLPAVKTRLRKLLGARYTAFMASFAVEMPFKNVSGFLFTTGCEAHSCTMSESAIAVDMATKTIHVGIYRLTTKAKFYNEAATATPQPISEWGAELAAQR